MERRDRSTFLSLNHHPATIPSISLAPSLHAQDIVLVACSGVLQVCFLLFLAANFAFFWFVFVGMPWTPVGHPKLSPAPLPISYPSHLPSPSPLLPPSCCSPSFIYSLFACPPCYLFSAPSASCPSLLPSLLFTPQSP